MVILSIPLIQEGQFSVTGECMCILIRRLKPTGRCLTIKLIALCIEMFRYLDTLSSVHVGPFLILGDLISCKGDHSTKSRIAKEICMKGQRSEVTMRVLN